MSLTEGERVGPYRVGRKLGAGAFGGVWLCEHAETHEPVAIKALTPSLAKSRDAATRFRREGANLQRIRSDYVGRFIETLEDERHGILLVMEFLEGDLLSDILEQTVLSVPEALELGIHIASGLVDMHQAGIIHRDIKPANIMLRPLENGLQRAVIFDLGLSRFVSSEPNSAPPNALEITASRVTVGTVGFMAPEQVIDGHNATERSDVYAAGVVLYIATSGYLPFDGEDREIAHRKLSEEAPKLNLGRIDRLNLEFVRVVSKAIRRRPAERYLSAQELLNELLVLRELAASMPSPRPSPFPPADPHAPPMPQFPPQGPVRRPTPKSYGSFPALMPLAPESVSRTSALVTRSLPAEPEERGGFPFGPVLAVVVALAIAAAVVYYAIT
jgi:serine/threonine-protein kinase